MTASLVTLTGARATTAAFFMPVKTPSEERGCILRLYQPVSLDSGPFKFFLSVPIPHSILNSEVQYLPPPLPPRLSSRNQISWILTDLQHLPECVKWSKAERPQSQTLGSTWKLIKSSSTLKAASFSFVCFVKMINIYASRCLHFLFMLEPAQGTCSPLNGMHWLSSHLRLQLLVVITVITWKSGPGTLTPQVSRVKFAVSSSNYLGSLQFNDAYVSNPPPPGRCTWWVGSSRT